jgi:lipopolysaccharide transport system ATP-binding protein
MRGRVASLLEVGTGFHPELTGRENIFLNGAILGMKQREIRKKFNEIIDFAETEKFLDTPVKFYSSGMYTRLAFSVAAHLDPEILIIDEVLAVGDAAFQKKCLGKMEEVSLREGRTVIFVSHNMGAVSKLCTNTILLEQGKIIDYGRTNDVIKKYMEGVIKTDGVYEQPTNKKKKMNLRKIYLVSKRNRPTNNVNYNENITVRVEYEVNKLVSNCIVWIHLMTIDGIVVFCTADYDLQPELREKRQPGYYKADILIPNKWLNPGTYIINVGINSYSPIEVYDRKDTIKFNVIDDGSTPKALFDEASRNGILQPFISWRTEKN